MRSVDEYKMVLHNSAIVINDCTLNDFPTLIYRFRIYDPVYHKSYLVGIYYDEENRKLYLPRGIDVDFVRHKVESTMEEKFSSIIIHNNPYAYVTDKINMLYSPRDDVQIEALKFALCKEKYRKNSYRSQFAITLQTGKGKTYISSCVISYLGIRSIIITAQSGILDQWRSRLLEYTDIDSSEIVKIEGGYTITRILNDSSTIANKSVYLCTHSTLHSYGSQFGWDKIEQLFKKLKIGLKFFDEAHQNFNNMALIDYATKDTWRTYYITATPSRSDRKEDVIYKLYMKNVPAIDLFNPDIDAHTNYIAIKYNSMPRPSDINICKNNVYGLSNPAYIDYIIKNERFWIMFDYIFSSIYRTGGRALFYIGTNSGILKVRDRILLNYPELIDDIGIYSSANVNKLEDKNKKYILSTTKSAGAGEDIAHLKYSVVLAEPFKSEVLARQTLGRTRDANTTYIELVDVGFRQIVSYFNAKKAIFQKYALSTKIMNVDQAKLNEISKTTKQNIQDRFQNIIEENVYGPIDVVSFTKEKMVPIIYFGANTFERGDINLDGNK